MPTKRCEWVPSGPLDMPTNLEDEKESTVSDSGTPQIAMRTLNSPGIDDSRPLSQSIEDAFPNIYRTISTSRSQRHSAIRDSWMAPRPAANTEFENIDGGNVDLPPIDGGRQAWLFMVGAFMVEGLMWGFPLTFGVFQNYYERNPPFQNSKNLAIVGTICTGISYLGTPLITPITIKYPIYQRHMIWVGWLICIGALVGSSFSTQLWHLIISQGMLYGVGFLFMYYPLLSMLNEWFDKKRGLAYGIMFGSAGVCGLGLPFLTELLLDKYGYATTLRAYAVAIFVLVGPTLPLLRPRLPPEKRAGTKIDISVFLKPSFLAMSFSNLVQGLVFFLPGVFISSYGKQINLSPALSTLLLSLLNLTQIPGQILTGRLSDHTSPFTPLFLSTLLSSLTVFLLWGFSASLAPLIIFALLYGFFAGGYSVLYCRFVTTLTDDRATGLWLYSCFEFQRGVGNIVGGVVSGLLVGGEVELAAYGVGKYRNLIFMLGAGFFVSSFGAVGWWFRNNETLSWKGKGVEEDGESEVGEKAWPYMI